MQRAPIVDSSHPHDVQSRRRLAAAIGSALTQAMRDPARMLPLWTVFSRGEAVPSTQLRGVLGDDVVGDALRNQLLVDVDVGDELPWVRSTVCIVAANVSGELLWIASDFPWYDDLPDAVTGPGEASHTLLAAVPTGQWGSVLDMGCGSGAIGVHLARGCDARLTATDLNPRALAFTELTAALNDVPARTIRSDFASAVTGRFDLVVCNPPFVLRRPDGLTTFRDSADALGHALLASQIAPLLTPDGIGLYLTNWAYHLGESDPLQVLAEQLGQIDGYAVLLLERAVVPVSEYVRLWTEDDALAQRWRAAFDADDVAHVGTGLVAVRPRTGAAAAVTIGRAYDVPREDLHRVVEHWYRPE